MKIMFLKDHIMISLINTICDNIDVYDAKAFFDINLEMTDESFDSSEYDSIVLSSTDEEENDVVSVDECSNFLTQLICTILILWHAVCIFHIRCCS